MGEIKSAEQERKKLKHLKVCEETELEKELELNMLLKKSWQENKIIG